MAKLVLSGVVAIGIGGGHAMLLRCLTDWCLGSRAVRTLLVVTAVLRFVLVGLIAAVLWWWGPGPAIGALVGCWMGRTMALARR